MRCLCERARARAIVYSSQRGNAAGGDDEHSTFVGLLAACTREITKNDAKMSARVRAYAKVY